MGERIDKQHRLMLRIDQNVHRDIQALAFQHQTSLNNLYNEMIAYAMKSSIFKQYLAKVYPVDERRGHFVYVENGR